MKNNIYAVLALSLIFSLQLELNILGSFLEVKGKIIVNNKLNKSKEESSVSILDLSINDEHTQLNEILKKTSDYCEKLKKMALDFVCHENIEENIYSYKKTETYAAKDYKSATPISQISLKLKNSKKNIYLYDYQMIKKGDKQEEKRILLKENNKDKHVENAELKIKGFKAQYLVYGPIGFLSKYWQRHFNYEIIGQDEINGKMAIVISATPTKLREENYNFGKIWVDENDFSILKIEWDPRYIKGYKEKASTGIKRTLTWAVFYEFEKNNVRFPSRQRRLTPRPTGPSRAGTVGCMAGNCI